jgi:hypothetical protein
VEFHFFSVGLGATVRATACAMATVRAKHVRERRVRAFADSLGVGCVSVTTQPRAVLCGAASARG